MTNVCLYTVNIYVWSNKKLIYILLLLKHFLCPFIEYLLNSTNMMNLKIDSKFVFRNKSIIYDTSPLFLSSNNNSLPSSSESLRKTLRSDLTHELVNARRRRMREAKKGKWPRVLYLWKKGKRRRAKERRIRRREREREMKRARNEGASKASRGSYTNFPVEVRRTPWVHLEEPFLEDPSI